MKTIEQQAAFLKLISHPVRLEILRLLLDGEACVFKTNELLNVSQPNLSQHLSALKKAGVVDCRIDGAKRCYFICKPTLVVNLLRLLDMQHEYKPCPKIKEEMKSWTKKASKKE